MEYRGLDLRLDYGEKYDVLVTEDSSGGYGVTVRTGIFRKVKKYYSDRWEMEREWKRTSHEPSEKLR